MADLGFLKVIGSWRDVADSAKTTIGQEAGKKDPSSAWKIKMLLAEHSPLRQIIVKWKWVNLPSWVSVHFVRHKIGIEHFVKTQRSDRTGVNRNKLPQDAPVDHECMANFQAMINISRKRCCNKASPETKEAWKLLLWKLAVVEPELASVCVKECVYRGFCPEFTTCGYVKTSEYVEERFRYKGLSCSVCN
jgi:hypothetical protein